MRLPKFSSLCLALALLVVPLSPSGSSGAPFVDDPEALLSAGKAEEALAAAEAALEHRPDDPGLLFTAARAAQALERKDDACWYATLAWEKAAGDKEHKKLAAQVQPFLEALQPEGGSTAKVMEDYAESLFQLAKLCKRKKLYANMVDLLARCRGTRFEKRADEELEKLFKNEKAIEALLASGIDIPAKPVTKKKPEWIAREDRKHADWENRYEVKSKYYTVETNMGYEMAQSISLAMEQMNGFYRKVFQYKTRGQTMRRCVLRVYGTRDEFDHHEGGLDPGIKGFFVPLENRVATYDPRTEPSSRPLTYLWSTLFHEASHQFTRALSTATLPGWLNEGTAAYFEGATLLPSGYVETNQVPENRLRNLLILLKQGSPTVKQVVSYFQPGSPPGDYYPFSWGLVYFIQNYENEASERVYLPVYQEYMKSYKSGNQHDPFERFTEYFVGKAAQPGIDSFTAFVDRWRTWIEELGELYFGGPEKADILLARADKQMANGKYEYAVESLKWAIQKRYNDPLATFRLGEALTHLEASDGAMFSFRKVLSEARARGNGTKLEGFDQGTEDVMADCLARISTFDAKIGAGIQAADASFADQAASAARVYVDAGYPKSALQLLKSSSLVLGGDAGLASLRDEIRSSSGLDLRRWRRLRVGGELELWETNRFWEGADDGIRADLGGDGLSTTVYREDVPDAYRYEAMMLGKGNGDVPVYGLVFGVNNQTGMRIFLVMPDSMVALGSLEEGPKIVEAFGPAPEIPAEGLRLAIEVTPTEQTYFIGDKQVGKTNLAPHEAKGRIGLCAQDVKLEAAELRLRY